VDSGNGGYSAGCFAKLLDVSPARVILLEPPPLEEQLTIQEGDRGMVACRADGTVIAAGGPSELEIEIPVVPGLEVARQASKGFVMAHNHFFPECFVCGTKRSDGLSIHPGLVEGTKVVATPWKPDASLSTDGVFVDTEIVWAALDCPGGIACLQQGIKPIVLGKMCAEIRSPIPINEELVVIGWHVETDGKKEHVGAAIATASRRILAVAAATWIVLDEDQSSFKVNK
jgi:hypothetical protein